MITYIHIFMKYELSKWFKYVPGMYYIPIQIKNVPYLIFENNNNTNLVFT